MANCIVSKVLFIYLTCSLLKVKSEGFGCCADSPKEHTSDCEEGVESLFLKNDIEPDAIPVAPNHLLKIRFNDKVLDLGCEISPLDGLLPPSLEWDADPRTFYTLIMIDPDYPSRDHSLPGSRLKWLVMDIPGGNVSDGKLVVPYTAPGPNIATGYHRYITLMYSSVYPKFNKLTDADLKILQPVEGVVIFDIEDFVEKCHLGAPVFGHFFQSQNDVSVVLNEAVGAVNGNPDTKVKLY